MLLGSSHNEAICLQVQADPRRCPRLLNRRKASVYRGVKNRSANWRSRRLEARGSQAENQADKIHSSHNAKCQHLGQTVEIMLREDTGKEAREQRRGGLRL